MRKKQLMSSARNSKDKASGSSDEWGTPKFLYEQLNSIFNFTVDLAANKKSTLHNVFCSDIFSYEFNSDRFYLNPPYSIASKFIDIVLDEENVSHYESGVLLLANRPDTRWFQKIITSEAVRAIFMVSGRLHFRDPKNNYIEQKNAATFPSLLVFIGNKMLSFEDLSHTNVGIPGLWFDPRKVIRTQGNLATTPLDDKMKIGLKKISSKSKKKS